MKNTMKKLLCMALAIMLLVSAVPVFAAASAVTDSGNASYTVYIDGKAGPTGTIDLTSAIKCGSDALRVVNPDYVLTYNFVGFYVNEVPHTGSETDVITNGCRLRFELETKPAEKCTVHLVLDGVDRSFEVDKGSTQKLDTALVRSMNFNIPGGYIVKQFVLSDGSRLYPNGSYVVVDYNMTLNVVLAPDSADDNQAGGTGSNSGSGSNTGNSGSGGSADNNNNSGSTGYTYPDIAKFYLDGKLVYSRQVSSALDLENAKAEAVNVIRNMGYKVTSWSAK